MTLERLQIELLRMCPQLADHTSELVSLLDHYTESVIDRSMCEDFGNRYPHFTKLLPDAIMAATKAIKKFPQPNYVTLKIAEEAGEVVRGCVHHVEGRMEWAEVEGEIIQLLAMIIRLVTEGDGVIGLKGAQGELPL